MKTDHDKLIAIRKYIANGGKWAACCKEFHCSNSTIKKALKTQGKQLTMEESYLLTLLKEIYRLSKCAKDKHLAHTHYNQCNATLLMIKQMIIDAVNGVE